MNTWVPISGCGDVVITPGVIQMDAPTITGKNVADPLSKVPDGNFMMIVLNGQVFFPIAPSGKTPPFSITGQTINWLSTTYAFHLGDTLIAVYSWGGVSG